MSSNKDKNTNDFVFCLRVQLIGQLTGAVICSRRSALLTSQCDIAQHTALQTTFLLLAALAGLSVRVLFFIHSFIHSNFDCLLRFLDTIACLKCTCLEHCTLSSNRCSCSRRKQCARHVTLPVSWLFKQKSLYLSAKYPFWLKIAAYQLLHFFFPSNTQIEILALPTSCALLVQGLRGIPLAPHFRRLASRKFSLKQAAFSRAALKNVPMTHTKQSLLVARS